MFTLRAFLIGAILSVSVSLQYTVGASADLKASEMLLQQPQSSLRKVLKETEPVLFNTIADSSGSSSTDSTMLTPRRLRKKKRKLQKLPEDGKINNTMGKQAQQKQQAYEQLFRSLFQEKNQPSTDRHRQAKLSPLSDLLFDVFKEIVAELITETVGSYLGFNSTRRTDSEVSAVGSGLMDMILDAVRKHTLRKKRGCIWTHLQGRRKKLFR